MLPDQLPQPAGDLQQPLFETAIRDWCEITPAATMRCSRAIAIDYAITGALPSRNRCRARARYLRQRLQLLLVDIEVGVDVLHVVVIFERFAQPQHAAGVLAFQLDQVLGHHGDGGVFRGNAVGLQSLEHGFVRFRRGEDLPSGRHRCADRRRRHRARCP